jgi:hypothetical protein
MMKNPPVTPQTSKQAYDSRTPYGFDRTLLATLPIQINEGDSLVVAHSEIPTGHFAFDGSPKISFIESAAVLTGWNKQDVCSSYVLSQNRVTLFRPSFSGVKQAFDGIHFRFDKLPIPIHIPNPPSVNLFLGSSPKLNLTSSSWAGEYWSPNDLGENYQAYLGRLWGERLLLAMGDSVNFEQKIELLVTAVQNQIDIVGVLKGGGGWPAEDGGGHQIGLLAQIRFFGHMFDQPDLAHPLLNDGKFTEHNGQFYLSGPGFFYEPNQKSLWRMSLGGAPLMEQSALSWDATARHSMLYLACCTVSQSMAGWMALSILGVFDSQNDPADKQLHDFTKWYFAPISPQFQVDANIPGLWSSVSGIAAQLMPQYGEAFR